MRFALVLSGGGTSGVAWETGVLKGLRDAGVDLTEPDLFVGTSAGAIVGAQLATGHDLDELFNRQLQPPQPGPIRNVDALMRALGDLRRRAPTPSGPLPAQLLAELGAAALAAQTESEQSRLATVKSYLPLADAWPERPLRITALDTADGSLVVWDRNSNATLVEAVASSCAAPLIAPPTTIGERRYMDAGVLSGTHAQLAAGHPLVVVLAVTRPGPPLGPLADEIATLRLGGSRVELVLPDPSSLDAMFPNPLDQTRRKAAAEAGHTQGLALATTVREWINV